MPSSSRKAPVSLVEHLRADKQQGPLTAADIAHEVKASLKVAPDVVMIPLELIDLGRLNPRKRCDDKDLEALADTIGATGLVHPLVVRTNPDDPRRFETIAGARRLQAAHIVWGRGDPDERARVAELPCVIKDISDTEAFIAAVAENASRADLTLAEMIDAVRRLRDDTRWSGAEIARRIGRHRAYVSELLAVADNPDLSRLVGEEVIAPKTAVVIAHMPDELKRAAIERARRGQLRTKADAERLRMQDRLLQGPHTPAAAPTVAGAPSVQAPPLAGTDAAARSPANTATTIDETGKRSPENISTANDTVGRVKAPPAAAPAAVIVAGDETLGREARALRLAETMAGAVDTFLEYMREAPGLPEDDPAMVLFQRVRKALAHFEAMRHVCR